MSSEQLFEKRDTYLTGVQPWIIPFYLLSIVPSQIVHHCLGPIDCPTSVCLVTKHGGKRCVFDSKFSPQHLSCDLQPSFLSSSVERLSFAMRDPRYPITSLEWRSDTVLKKFWETGFGQQSPASHMWGGEGLTAQSF